MLKKKKQAEGFVQKPQPESDVSIVSSFAKLTHLPCMVGFAFNLEPPRQKSRLKLQTLHLDDSKIHVEFEKKTAVPTWLFGMPRFYPVLIQNKKISTNETKTAQTN